MARERWATFDCYGTLIDWNGGIRRELARVFGEERADAQLERYHELEPTLQAGGGAKLPGGDDRGDARRSAHRGARRAGSQRLCPSGAPFRRFARRSKRHVRAAGSSRILSNTDRDFIEASIARIGVPFELAIVASEIDSYKPRHRHWLQFLEETGAPRDAHVHVAQSHYHDIVPANELGLQSIWINRYGEQHEPPPTRELADLSALPDTLDELVAP